MENVINYISSKNIKSINKNCALESLQNFEDHVIEFTRIVNREFFGMEPDADTIKDILQIVLEYVGEHYKYGISETGMLRKFAEYFKGKLENAYE